MHALGKKWMHDVVTKNDKYVDLNTKLSKQISDRKINSERNYKLWGK